jgi:hypothetical protein
MWHRQGLQQLQGGRLHELVGIAPRLRRQATGGWRSSRLRRAGGGAHRRDGLRESPRHQPFLPESIGQNRSGRGEDYHLVPAHGCEAQLPGHAHRTKAARQAGRPRRIY